MTRTRLPAAVFVLGAAEFCMSTAEVLVAGLLPQLARSFAVSVPAIGNLVSVYAAGMALGGPVLTLALLRQPRKTVLLVLLGVFLGGQTLGALAVSYPMMVCARILTGVAAAAFIGISTAVCVELVGSDQRGRALSVLFGGLMLAQVVSLPGATMLGHSVGWRAAFWSVAALTAACVGMVAVWIPRKHTSSTVGLRDEVAALANGRLWITYATNALTIGAVYTAFSYLVPLLISVAGFRPAVVPGLLTVYGVATLVGNMVSGRLADRNTLAVLACGLLGLMLTLTGFALVASHQFATIIMLVVLGLVGLPLNPAIAARVVQVSNERPLVQTVNTAALNVGIVVGPSLAGASINTGGLVGVLWVGAGLATVGLGTLLPFLIPERSHTQACSTTPCSEPPEHLPHG